MLCGSCSLRYVLKNKDTGEVLFVVVFSLLKKADFEKEEAEAAAAAQPSEKRAENAGRHEGEANFEPSKDDVD